MAKLTTGKLTAGKLVTGKEILTKEMIARLPKNVAPSEDGLIPTSLRILSNLPPKLPTKIKLQSLEGKIFEIDYNVAKMSQTIKSMVEESEIPTREDVPIKLNAISNEALSKIIEYCKHYHGLPPLPEDELSKEKRKRGEIRDFDLKFVQSLDKNLLFELIMAANFLFIRGLIDLLCKHTVNMYLKGKTVEEVRRTFNLKNDFTNAEEEQLKNENAWIEKKDPIK